MRSPVPLPTRHPLATTAVTFSGLGPHDRPTLDRFLSGSTAWIEPYIDQVDEGAIYLLRGGTAVFSGGEIGRAHV